MGLSRAVGLAAMGVAGKVQRMVGVVRTIVSV